MTSSARPPEARVAVFAKAPVPGTVKTRLAGRLGADGAAKLHARLVERSLRTACEAAPGRVDLWCAPDVAHPFFQDCASRHGVALFTQAGEDLGARMRTAFEQRMTRERPLIVIGSDCPALDAATIREAARQLLAHDAVLAPAEDGGYTLLGLRVLLPTLFEHVAWGTRFVMDKTRERLRHAGASWHELPTLWDVDRPEDYERLLRAGWLVPPA